MRPPVAPILLLLLLLLLFPFLTRLCDRGGSGTDADAVSGDTLTGHARLLTLVDRGDCLVADIRNPWDTASLLRRYILIPDSAAVPANLPDGTIVRTPLRKSLVYSGVHAGAIRELGAVGAIRGVADASYFTLPEIRDGLAQGRIADVGSAMSPDPEKLAMLSPDAVLASPYQNADYGVASTMGFPIIECADYMEQTPLGRAEWIKLIGALYGRSERAAGIFDTVCSVYDSLAADVARHPDVNRPKVITERVTNGVWFMPGGRSYMSRIITDAGGINPWADSPETGSLQLDFAAAFERAHDADVWIIRNYGPGLTLGELRRDFSPNAKIKAFREGEVYVADTSVSTLFDDFPFHPERLLREYIHIFRGEADSTLYYKRIRP